MKTLRQGCFNWDARCVRNATTEQRELLRQAWFAGCAFALRLVQDLNEDGNLGADEHRRKFAEWWKESNEFHAEQEQREHSILNIWH